MDQLLMLAALMVATGCVAGVLAGLFGIGGGIVIVPVLEAALGIIGIDPAIRMHIAVATSLATIIPTSISSARSHHSRDAVDFDIVRRWAIFVLAGALLGSWIASRIDSDALATVFASAAILVALKMIFLPNPASMVADVPRRIWVSIIPVFIGCLSSMMGIGGGVLMVMSLTLFNQPIHRAIGTAALFGLVISVPGTVGFMILGFEDPRLPAGNVGYVSLIGVALIAPTTVLLAPFGAKLAHKLSSRQLSMLFGVFLFVAAGKLAFAAGEFEADASFECDSCAEWNQVQEPVHIFGNTYYVGMAGVSAVVIDAGTELVLIDGGLAQSAEHIVANIRALGFDPLAISTIVSSHAHNDHAGGIAALQRFTGAQVLSSEAGARALRAGDLMRDDPLFALGYENRFFPAVPEAIAVRDAAEHHLGDVVLRGLYTPGHTPGGMSWTWESCEGDRCLDIVYADSLSAVAATGYRFADGMGDVLRSSILKVADLRCDILLVSHPFLFNLQDKAEQDRESFVDDQSCRLYAESALLQLERRLASETAE